MRDIDGWFGAWRFETKGRKGWNVLSYWNTDSELLGFTLFFEVVVQPLPELPGIVADDVVLAGVIALPPGEDMYTDLMLADLIGSAGESTIADVQEKFGQKRRLSEALAGDDPLGELPTGVFGQI